MKLELLHKSTEGNTKALPNTAHDVMLESNWQVTADHILNWLHEKGM